MLRNLRFEANLTLANKEFTYVILICKDGHQIESHSRFVRTSSWVVRCGYEWLWIVMGWFYGGSGWLRVVMRGYGLDMGGFGWLLVAMADKTSS